MASKIGDDEEGKMFIGGISRETSEQTLRSYFEKFGAVKDCILMVDKETGNSRGFGFVTYVNPQNVDDVVAACPHTLDNKMIDPKKCTPRSQQQKKNNFKNSFNKTHKIFVGGLSMDATKDDVSDYFTKYGLVTEVILVADKNDPSRPHKGFGFVTFEDESSVDQAIAKHYHTIKDKRCEAKSAENRDKSQQNQGPGGFNNRNMMGFNNNMQQQPYGQQQNMMNQGYPPMNNMGAYNQGYNNQQGGQFNSFPTQYPQYNNQNPYQQGPNNGGFGGYPNYQMPNNNGNNMQGGNMNQQQQQGGYNMQGNNNNQQQQQPSAGYSQQPQQPGQAQLGGRGDQGQMYGQNQLSYGPMRGGGSAGDKSGNQQSYGKSYGNNNQQQQSGGNNNGSSAASGGNYHPYRR